MNTLHIAKERGRFDLKPVTDCFWDLPDGEYRVEVKRRRSQRTTSQNDYLWGVVYPAVLQGLIDAGWDEITSPEQVHELLKAKFLTVEAVNRHTGDIVSYPLSTARMDTLQFSTYVDMIIDFAREYLGVIIPPAEKKIKP